VERLRQEHEEILKAVGELINHCDLLASGSSLSFVPFRHRVSQVLSTIRRHEIEENGLIQRVFYQEVSVVD